MKKDRLILGQTDMDGSSHLLLFEYFGIPYDDVMIEEYKFFDEPEKIDYALSFKEIFFIDFSPDEAMVKKLLEKDIHFKVFDHHFSDTRKFLTELPEGGNYEIHIDEIECGTSLFFKKFILPHHKRIKPIVKRFVHLVWTYDTWRNHSEDWEEAVSLNRVFYRIRNYGALSELEAIEPFIEHQLRKFQYWNYWGWTKKELDVIEAVKKREKDVLDQARENLHFRRDHRGKLFGVWMGPSKISLTCSQLLKDYEDLDYMIAINTWGGLSGKMSFRSSRGFNCNEISIANGHDAAAGSQIDPDLIVHFMDNKHWCFAYKDEVDLEKIEDRYDIFRVGEEVKIEKVAS